MQFATVDSKTQHLKTITTVGGLCEVLVHTRLGIYLSMPFVAIKSCLGKVCCIAIVDS